MDKILIFCGIVVFIFLLILLLSYICFRIVFYAPRKKSAVTEEYPLPVGKIYEPYHEVMIKWMKDARTLPFEEFTITSFDGLKLYGKYFEYAKGAPIELMFHGYRGNAERDLCGGIQRCFSIGRNVLLIDQRTSCNSEGTVITFGVNECKDCLSWIDFTINHFGKDTKIILTGISMGAATVLMAAGHPLPENVVGVLADCGYSSAREIIKKCARQLHLPANLVYPFIKLGARLWGHFNLEEFSPIEAMKKCKVPVIFIHGDTDDFVPCEMSRMNFDACTAPKKFITIAGAGHGLAYPVDAKKYLQALCDFFTEHGLPTAIVTNEK